MKLGKIWIIDTDLPRAEKINDALYYLNLDVIIKEEIFDGLKANIFHKGELRPYSEIKPYTHNVTKNDVLFIHYNSSFQLYLFDFLNDLEQEVIVVHYSGGGIMYEQDDIFKEDYLENPRSVFIKNSVSECFDMTIFVKYLMLIQNSKNDHDLINAKDFLLGVNRRERAWREIFGLVSNPGRPREYIGTKKIDRIIKSTEVDSSVSFYQNKSLIQVLNELSVFERKFDPEFAKMSAELKEIIESKYLSQFR